MTNPQSSPIPNQPPAQPPAQPPEPTPPAPPAPTPLLHASGVEPFASGLTAVAYRLEEQGVWSFGLDLNGVYVELGRRKLGGVDDDLQEKATPGFKEQRAEQAIRLGLVH